MRIVVSGLALALLATPALAGPFGLDFGQRIASLPATGQTAGGIYEVEAPSPHPSFDTYAVRASVKDGVCEIFATSPLVDDAYGEKARATYNAVKTALTAKYGPPQEVFERLRAGAIWDGPREWAASVAKGERIHASLLRPGDGDAADRVRILKLDVMGDGLSDTRLRLQYQGDNFDSCAANIKATQDSVF